MSSNLEPNVNDESGLFTEDFRFKVVFTNDSDLEDGEPQVKTVQEVVNYLHESPRNAVILHGSHDEHFGDTTYDDHFYVLRGAGEGLNEFWHGVMPCEDGEGDGGDLTAAQALSYATIEYYE